MAVRDLITEAQGQPLALRKQKRQMPRQHAVRIAQFVHYSKMIGAWHRDQRTRHMLGRAQRMQFLAVRHQRREFSGPESKGERLVDWRQTHR